MPIENWEQIQDLFLAAADLPGEEQARFLDANCTGNQGLRREVESLLAADKTASESILAAVEAEAQSLAGVDSVIGSRLGAYRVIREIGRGGMGAVYLATRDDDQYHKQVAIKLVKHGMDTAEVLGRFRHERQILANLDHPYIARLIDGGTFLDGRPFFVMEYVNGQPIDSFCRDHHLNLQQRCRLFLKVCEAVSYAHRNLVIHRDLKPGNNFVTADGSPKLLDFGVAKLLTADAGPSMTATALFTRPLTPEYASPEQFRGQPVYTATDVYSLGAVLYEILTGSKARQIESSTPAGLERMICDTEVSRPSAAAAQVPWRKQLVGDLDNIVRMAMRQEAERRYPSVDQLAEDIRRYLDGRPISARKDSLGYRAGKFVRRRRLPLAAAVLVFASLLSGVIIALSQARQADAARRLAESRRQTAEREHEMAGRERDTAIHERARAEVEARNAKNEQERAEQRLRQMVELANHSLFDVHSSLERLSGATGTRREIVKTTLQFLEKLSKDAGQDEQLRLALSTAYFRLGDIQGYQFTPNLGDTAGALKSYREAAALIEPLRVKHPDDPDVLLRWVDIQRRIGTALDSKGDIAGAVKSYVNALPAARAVARLKRPGLAAVQQEGLLYGSLATALEYTDSEQAIGYGRKQLAIFAQLAALHPGNSEILNALSGSHALLGLIANRQGDLTDSLAEFRKCVAIREELVKDRPNDVVLQRLLMISYGHLASVLGNPFNFNLGDSEGAREYYGKAVALGREMSKKDPQDRTAKFDLASGMLRLAAIDPPPSERSSSLAMLRESGEILVALSAADPAAVRYKRSMGIVLEYAGHRLRDLGKPVEAIAEYRRSLEISEAVLAANPKDLPTHSQALADEQAIANVLAAQGDRAGALDYARKAVLRAERYLGDGPEQEIRTAYVPKAYFYLGDVYRVLAKRESELPAQRLADWREARGAAERAVSEWRALIHGREKHPYAPEAARAESLLAECQAQGK
jgi:serine/threonine protein kinase/tetratricopeptide (TPR) repeat protein